MISFAHREPGLGKIWRCRPPLCCTFFPCRHRCCCLLVLCFLCLPRVGQPRVLGLSLSRSMSLSLPVLQPIPIISPHLLPQSLSPSSPSPATEAKLHSSMHDLGRSWSIPLIAGILPSVCNVYTERKAVDASRLSKTPHS